MTTEQHQNLEDIVRRVIAQLGTQPAPAEPSNRSPVTEEPHAPATVEDAEIPDIRAVDYRDVYKVPNPAKPEEFARLKARTWARLGLGRTGPRYTTAAQLRFWADQAAAMDAVFTDVAPDWLERAGLFMVQTKCTSRDQYLTNPELGTQFEPSWVSFRSN